MNEQKNLEMYYKIQQLENILSEYEYHYRVLNNPIVSDEVFDFTKKELQKLSEQYPEYVSENSPLKKIGSVLVDGFQKVKHKRLMGSIENSYSHDDLREWDKKISKQLGCNPNSIHYTIEDKFDGISGSLHYNNNLTLAVTRGDGDIGDDITNNAKMVLNIPLHLNFEGEIRGEFVIFKDQLERINKDENADYKNVRNLVSGTMKSLDSNVIRRRSVIFIPYYLYDKDGKELSFDDGNNNANIFGAFWDKMPTMAIYGGTIEKIIEYINDFENKDHYRYYKNRKWLVDGAVVKVSQFEFREVLGYSSSCPNWAKAFKFSQDKAITQMYSVTWQVGRECISPVAELVSVELEGTTVSRASLHNVTQFKRLGVSLGCMVEIEKAGFIIPYINKVVEGQIEDNSFLIPVVCPECHSPTAIVKINSEDLVCTNDLCPAKLVNNTIYMVKALGIEEVGSAIIQELVNKKMIKTQFDILKLSYDSIMTLERMGKTKATKIFNNIQKGLIQPFNKFIECLGILTVGESTSEKLASKFNTFDLFVSATFDQLCTIEGVGESTSEKIVEYIKKNKEMLYKLKDLFVIRKEEGFSNKLSGKKIVITGAAVKSRDELYAMVKKNGGEIASSVSKKTDVVIIGSKEPVDYNSSKKSKAIELNIPVVNEFWLFDQIGFVEEKKEEVKKADNVVSLSDMF